jgi:hypothetical protein
VRCRGRAQPARMSGQMGQVGGIVSAGVGGFTLLISLPIALLGAALEANDKDGAGLLIGGGAASAVGAGLLIGGVSMIVGSKTAVFAALGSAPLRFGGPNGRGTRVARLASGRRRGSARNCRIARCCLALGHGGSAALPANVRRFPTSASCSFACLLLEPRGEEAAANADVYVAWQRRRDFVASGIHMGRASAHRAWLQALVLVIAMPTGCARMNASTDLTRVKDPAYANLAFRRAAVFADAPSLQQRRLIEDAVVFELARAGFAVRPSIEILPPTRDYTPEERVQALLAAKMDGIIVVAGESGVTSVYVPVTETRTTTTGDVVVQGNTAQYRETARTDHQGGYTITKPWAKITTRVIDLRGGRVAWLAETDTRGNGFADFDDIRKSYARSLARQMQEDHVLVTRQELEQEARPATTTSELSTAAASQAHSNLPTEATAVAPIPAASSSPSSISKSEPLATRLEGCVIAGQDGQFLGRITTNSSDPDSVINDKGRSGSKTSKTSVFNTSSSYGSARDPMSAFNPAAASPPSIFCADRFEAYLTTNHEKAPAVDPRLLSAIFRSAIPCSKDTDCSGDLVCTQHKCSKP